MKIKSRLDKLDISLKCSKELAICIVNKCDKVMEIPSLNYKGPIEEGMKLVDPDGKNTFIITISVPRPKDGGE